jgi:thiamine biosynthesis protein ThiS
MKISLNYVALKLDNLPAEGKAELELAEGANLTQALDALGVGQNSTFVTLLNDMSIPRTERAATILADGDTLTLFSPIKGG